MCEKAVAIRESRSSSLLPCSNQQTLNINICILAVVTCEALLLYSAVGNVVVRSSPTICVMWKLSEAISVTNQAKPHVRSH